MIVEPETIAPFIISPPLFLETAIQHVFPAHNSRSLGLPRNFFNSCEQLVVISIISFSKKIIFILDLFDELPYGKRSLRDQPDLAILMNSKDLEKYGYSA